MALIGRKKKSQRRFYSSKTIEAAAPVRTKDDRDYHDIIPGFVYARVYFDRGVNLFKYEITEPAIRDRTFRLYKKFREEFFKNITDPNLFEQDKINKNETVDKFKRALKSSGSFTAEEIEKLDYYVNRDILGFGKIDPLMKDPSVEDISCDMPNAPVYIYHRSFGYIPTNIQFEDEELDNFIKKILQDVGRHISISNPIVDATLEDGSRISASFGKFITNRGSSFTIRKFKEEPLTPLDLIKKNLASSRVFAYFWVLVENGANIMVVGGTATGKTTFLNAILLFVPAQKKIISIEDTREINLIHENWVPMVTRVGYGPLDKETGKRMGEIDMFDLLTVTMRQRPSYIVVGEVRGAEAFTIFQAMSIGRYVFGTFHADDISTFIHRMESKPINVPRNLLLTLDVVVILQNVLDEKGARRRIKSVTEITGQDDVTEDIVVNNAYSLNEITDTQTYSGYSYVLKRIAEKEGKTESELEEEITLRAEILDKMIEKGIFNYKDFYRFVNYFYKERKLVFRALDMTDKIETREEKNVE